MRKNYTQTLEAIASDFGLDLSALAAYGDEDNIGGFGFNSAWPGGSVWGVEGKILYALVRLLKPSAVVECGTQNGCSTTHLLAALAANDGKRRKSLLTSLTLEGTGDLVPPELRKRWLIQSGVLAQEALKTDSSPYTFAFEDTDHTVPTTTAVLSALKSRPNLEWIVSHDIAHPWVGYAMREAWSVVFGNEWREYDIEPSDCGLAIWRRA